MKKTVLSVLALSALVYSCKKDDDKSNAEKLIGKWNKITMIENNHEYGVDNKDTLNYPAGSTSIEFLNNGTFYEKARVYNDTGVYKIDGVNLFLTYKGNTESDTLTIKSLTDNDMTLYYKDAGSNGDYFESTGTYKK
ncbi:MAG: lipocalin family protein [Niastella sp.]|uniref:lipocalin family protein n=1 Tax=Niastella sp. TaxID=1869183 RepID=UPI00389A5076